MDRIDAILAVLPANRTEIQAGTGIGKSTVQSIVERLHARGWIHICGWDRIWKNNTGRFVMRYKAGPGKDRVCTLKPLPREVIEKRRRKKLIQTGEIEERRAKSLMRYYEAQAKKKPRNWASALGL